MTILNSNPIALNTKNSNQGIFYSSFQEKVLSPTVETWKQKKHAKKNVFLS